MRNPIYDIRDTLRQLRKSPGFALTAVLTLALGIGSTTAIFSIVEGVLLRPLPFPAQSSLVMLGDRLEGADNGDAPYATAPGIRTYVRETHAFTDLGGYRQTAYELSGIGDPAQVNASRLTAQVFPALGVAPSMGRIFTRREDEDSQNVAVLSYQTWRGRFHGDPHVLGQKLLLDRKPYEIIGVMPLAFEFPLVPGQLNRSELWVPMSFTQRELVQGAGNWGYSMVGRLKPGVTPAQAQEDAGAAAQEIMRNFPPALSSRRIHAWVEPLDEVTVAQARPLLRTLFSAVLVVLFIACANLAGLLLVRVIRRRREISVRLALGASAAAIIRQSLGEALLLSVSGGVLGLILASGALSAGIRFLPETLPRVSSIGLDWRVVAFALGLSMITGVLCGLIPAFAASRTSINEALKEGGRTGAAGSGHTRLRSALVVVELAVVLVLLCASGLLLRSFEKMRSADLGFRADQAVTGYYSLPRQQYSTQSSIDQFNLALRAKLEAMPGVRAVGVTSFLPDAGGDYRATFTPEGYVSPKGSGLNVAWAPQAMGSYFQAQGIPIVRGRDFTAADDQVGAPLVAIVNRTLAEHYWPGQEPIGKRLHRGPAEADLPWLTVVGEIGAVKDTAADAPTVNQFYVPTSQSKANIGSFAPPNMLVGGAGSIVVRGALPPSRMMEALVAAVRSLDPRLPLTAVETMDQIVQEGQAPRRFNATLITAFAAAAALLAMMGIYSVIAFSTALRSHEMAIRLALGAGRSRVMGMIVASGVKLGLAGCGLGAIGVYFAARVVRSFLFQVDPLDPGVISVAAFGILLLAVAASVIPALRAATIEPVQALRGE